MSARRGKPAGKRSQEGAAFLLPLRKRGRSGGGRSESSGRPLPGPPPPRGGGRFFTRSDAVRCEAPFHVAADLVGEIAQVSRALHQALGLAGTSAGHVGDALGRFG